MAEMRQDQGLAGICQTFPPFSDDGCCADVGRTDLGGDLLVGAQALGAERKIPAPNVKRSSPTCLSSMRLIIPIG